MITEVFKELYINNYGYIKVGSLGTIIGKRGKMRPNNQNAKKYYRVHIGNRMYSVHRLVALAFIPNPNNLPQVNHKDGNKSNNTANNLEWVSDIQNKRHAVINGLSSAKIPYRVAKEIREKYNEGCYTYYDLAKIYDMSYSNVGYIVRHNTWDFANVEGGNE